MADWLSYLNQQAKRNQTFRPTYRPQYRPSYGSQSGSQPSYNPGAVGRSSSSMFSSGARAPQAPAAPYTPASAPERFDFSVPYSPYTPPGAVVPPAASTQGDLFASIGASMPKLDMANAIPWMMERVHVLAKGIADDNKGSGVGSVAGVAEQGTGAFLQGFEALSNMVAPVLDAFPNWVKDSQLKDRAKLYQGLVTGNGVDFGMGPISNPLSTLAKIANPMGGALSAYTQSAAARVAPGSSIEAGAREQNQGGIFGNTMSGQVSEFDMYRSLLKESLDPSVRNNADLHMQMIKEGVDLPQSVKDAIEANPGMSSEELDKLLASAPEGKQWSYDPGIAGIIQNAGNPLMIYGAEAVGMSRLVGGLSSAATENIVPSLIARGGTAARVGQGLGTTVSAVTRGVTMAAKLQKAYMLSGAGIGALSTGMESVARMQGNQAAIDWWSRINQPGEFAENPNVQLVSGFTVNPFEAIGLAKKGIIKLGNGAGGVFLGKTLGERFVKAHGSDELVYGILSKMYRLGGVDEAKTFASKYYDGKGEVFDEVVGQAANRVLEQQLPREERLALLAAYPDAADLTKHVLSTYGSQIMDVLERQGNEVAQGWFRDHWEYHQYPGAFDPDVAALNAKDYRLAKGKSYVLRQQLDAVIGYQEYVNPEGAGQARLWLERVAKDGKVAVKGVDGLQDLVRRFPAMRKYWQGIVKGGDTFVSKDAVETIIQRSEADFKQANKQNPVRARTGADPVIRPDSPRRDYDRAEALGTDVATVRAIDAGAEPGKGDLFRQFLADKGVVEPDVAAAMDTDAAWMKAAEYVYNTEKPWVAKGEAVSAGEKRLTTLKSELRRLEATAPRMRSMAWTESMNRVQHELAQMTDLIREAGDPVVTYADDLGLERTAARRADQVRKMNPDHLTESQSRYLRQYVQDAGNWSAGDLKGRDLWEAANEVAAQAPKVTGRDIAIAERAARKVAAVDTLRRLSEIDSATSILGFDGGSDWTRLIRRGPNGEWTWSGGKPVMSVAIRTRIADWLRSNGRRGTAQTMMEYGDEEAWNVALRQYPDSLEALTRTQRAAVSRAVVDGAGDMRVDEYAQRAIDASSEDLSTDAFLERIFKLADERQKVLDQANVYGSLAERNLVSQAGMDIPVEYLREAESDLASRSIYYDPEYESVLHPDAVAKVAQILASPEDQYPALSSIVKADPILEGKAQNVALAHKVSVEAVLRDPTYAAALRKELIPADFEPRQPGYVAETELDQLVLDGDSAAIAERSQQLRDAADLPHDPIKTTVSSAKRQRPAQPTRVYRERLAAYGADLTEAPDAAILADPLNRVGLDVLSLMNHGIADIPPATVRGTLAILQSIEHGAGVRMGLGASAQAEGQRVAKLILDKAVGDAKRLPFVKGTFGPGLDPASFAFDEWVLAKELPISELKLELKRTGGGSAASMQDMVQTLKGTLDGRQIAAGKEAMSQRVNTALGLAKGAEEGTGGATRANVPGIREVPLGDYAPAGTERWVHYTDRASADAILHEGFKAGDRNSLGGATGFPEGTTFVGRDGGPFMEYMASEWRVKFKDAPFVKLAVDVPKDAKLLDAGMTPTRADIWKATHSEEAMARFDELAQQKVSFFAKKAAAAQVAKEFGFDGVVFDNEEIALFPSGQPKAPPAAAKAPAEAASTGGRISFEDGGIKAELSKNVEITYSADDPLGTLQYGFKKRPKAAVVMELAKVPGLSEEFVTSRFNTWQERVWTSKVRQAYNYVFGPLSNTQVRGAVHQRFVDRLAAQGIDGEVAESVWKRWQAEADGSRSPEIRVDEQGRRRFSKGDNPLYASVGNIPNARMDQWAHEAIDQALDARGRGMTDPAYRDMAHRLDYSTLFREASSFTRRNLMDLPAKAGHETLGKALSTAYGHVAHNSAVTTAYYWFRFGLDVRYHAMNFFEAQLLHLGRAGLRNGEIDNGLMGNTEGFLRKLDQDYIDNTGYATSRSRFAYAYRTFLKEQPDMLRGNIRGLAAEDPALMETALREMATNDPALRSLLKDMGDTPDGWMKAMDEFHGKMLRTVSEQDGDMVIDQLLAAEISKSPAMAEVYGKLGQANKDLWRSVRETFYGNPDRSRAERFLNSYLLFWPLSYQVKSSKWLLHVLYDRAGGLPTNGAGAVLLDRVAQTHQQLLATDPEYQDWYEKHPTMAFVAQMFLPITPDSMGVSLSPALRSIFFGRSKAWWDIGPIYTVNHVVKPLADEIGADLYPTLKDIPGIDGIYRANTGKAPPWAQD